MRLHVAFEPRLVVERFAALQAGMVFLFGMVPCMFQQRSFVLAMLTTQTARIFGQLFCVHRRYVGAYALLLRETFTAQHALEHDDSRMNFGMRQQVQRLGKRTAANVATMVLTSYEIAARCVRLIVSARMAFQQVQSMERHTAHIAIVIAEFRIRLIARGRFFIGLIFRSAGDIFAMLGGLVLLQLLQRPEHVAATVAFERIVDAMY